VALKLLILGCMTMKLKYRTQFEDAQFIYTVNYIYPFAFIWLTSKLPKPFINI